MIHPTMITGTTLVPTWRHFWACLLYRRTTCYGMIGVPVACYAVLMDGLDSQPIVTRWEAIHSPQTMTASVTRDLRAPLIVNLTWQLRMIYDLRYLQCFQRVLQGLVLLHQRL